MFPPSVQSSQNLVRTQLLLLDLKLPQVFVMHLLHHVRNLSMDGAKPLRRFWHIILPHLARAITVVVLIQTIFLLSIFAEIFVTTAGAFGTKTLTYLIFQRVLESQNVGLGSAGGVYAIILANIVAIFLMRIVGKNLDK